MNPAVTHLPRLLTVYVMGDAELDQATGKTVRQVLETTSIRATIQPAQGRSLDDFPEGIRETARWIIWTMNQVKAGWWVKYGDELYRVDEARTRHETGHTKAALGKLGEFEGTIEAADVGTYLTLGGDTLVTMG